MQIDSPRFAVWIDSGEVDTIRRSLDRSGAVAQSFSGASLHAELEAWDTFVNTEWDSWDFSEYDHDIGCRYLIQLAIELTSAETAGRLAAAVGPLDDTFKNRMRPCAVRVTRGHLELSLHPYFWEDHTIHPDQQ